MPGLLPAVLNLLFKRCRNRFKKKEKNEPTPTPSDEGGVYRVRYDPRWNVLRMHVRGGAFKGAGEGTGMPNVVNTAMINEQRGFPSGDDGGGGGGPGPARTIGHWTQVHTLQVVAAQAFGCLGCVGTNLHRKQSSFKRLDVFEMCSSGSRSGSTH
jgi:hypothetical protein